MGNSSDSREQNQFRTDGYDHGAFKLTDHCCKLLNYKCQLLLAVDIYQEVIQTVCSHKYFIIYSGQAVLFNQDGEVLHMCISK